MSDEDEENEEVTIYSLQKVIVKMQKSFDLFFNNFNAHKDDVKKRLDTQAKYIKDLEKVINEKIESEIRSLQNYIDQEVGRLVSRAEDVEARVKILEERQSTLKEFNYDETVIINNLQQKHGEDLEQTVDRLVRQGLHINNLIVVKTKRLYRRDNKPGLVKVQLQNVEDKVKVLKAKQMLSGSAEFCRVCIRSSKPYAERVAEDNWRTMLNAMSLNKDWYVSGNGKLTSTTQPRYNAAVPHRSSQVHHDYRLPSPFILPSYTPPIASPPGFISPINSVAPHHHTQDGSSPSIGPPTLRLTPPAGNSLVAPHGLA